MVFVELPKVGAKVTATKNFGVVESVKAVSDLFAPISGEVAEVNGELGQKPEIVNQDPYGKGWMLVVKPSGKGEWDQLLTAQQYEELIAQGIDGPRYVTNTPGEEEDAGMIGAESPRPAGDPAQGAAGAAAQLTALAETDLIRHMAAWGP